MLSNKFEKYVVNGIHWEKNLPDHEGSIGEKGFPILMSSGIVPEANAWVCPALMNITEDVMHAVKSGAMGKANPHIHDGDEMYLIVGEEKAATIAVSLGDDYYEIKTPGAVYIPAGLPHSIQMIDGEIGKFGGACPVYLGTNYITKPVPDNPLRLKDTKHLVVDGIHWENNLTDHEGSIGEKGFPILMSSSIVPEANAWVCPALMSVTQEILDSIKKGSMGKANRHVHDGDEMYLIVGQENAATIAVTLGDDYYEIKTPGAVYIPAGVPHSIEMIDGEIGKFGGACPVYLGTEYITKPVPENWD